MKIGILGAGYQLDTKLDERLKPWFDLAAKHNFVFSLVSAQFKEYAELGYKYDNEETEAKLFQLSLDKKIQYLEIPKVPLDEKDARNLALNHLLKEKCDYVWLLDLSDEFYTREQIESIICHVTQPRNKFITYWSIPFKNYIFDGKSWIDGFNPPRIFSAKCNNYELDKMYYDNDFTYKGTITRDLVSYKQLSGSVVPKTIIKGGIKHLTWLHTNAFKKISYQLKHFNGICGYKWNKEKQECEFNLEHYDKHNLLLPIVHRDLENNI